MISLTFFVGYIAIVAFFVLVISKAKKFMSRPLHIRWELYPVPHEGERAAWGGSYLEESDWWKKSRIHSMFGMAKGLAEEMLLLHLTFVHNRDLWCRTYPFHGGLYLCLGSFLLTAFAVVLAAVLGLNNSLIQLALNFAQILATVGLICVAVGSLLLLQRRLGDKSLRMFSTPEHFFNLAVFGIWAVLALVVIFTSGYASFAEINFLYITSLFTVNSSYMLLSGASTLYYILVLYTFFLIVFVPMTHMGHFFMKYFTWHNIRWDDTPTLDDAKLNAAIGANLGRKPTWAASHIQGDGNKTWADIAMTNPTEKKD